MSFEAIVLAGGLGTRLRSVTGDLPKVMANVADRPFLEYVLDGLACSGVHRAVLAVGYKHQVVREHFGDRYRDLSLSYSVEETQLGTGGAVLHALSQTSSESVLVLNGDTWVDIDHDALMDAHRARQASLTMSIAPVPDSSRFGTVEIVEGHVAAFNEKGLSGPGLINAGVYALSTGLSLLRGLGPAFSLERDFLEPNLKLLRPVAFMAREGFFDIGVPEDYARASAHFRAAAAKRRERST